MPLDLFQKALIESKKHTNLITYHMLGDPLYHKNICEYLNLTKKHNLRVEITTTGVYLDDFDLLLQNPIKQINFSLDALFYSNLDTRKYLNRIFDFCAYKLNTKSTTFINLRIQNLPKNKALIDSIESKFNVNINSSNIRLSSRIKLILTRHFKWNEFSNIYSNSGFCYALRGHIGILSNGDIVPCCMDVNGTMILGNIKIDSIKKALSSPRAKNMILGFKNNILLEESCKKCDYKNKFRD